MSDLEPEPAAGLQSVMPAEAPRTAVLTQQALGYLGQTQPWVRFISILIFVSAALMALLGIGMMVVMIAGGLTGRGLGRELGAIGGLAAGSFYLMMACLYVAPGVFLQRYAGAIRQLKLTCAPEALEDALRQQRSFWRFVGILSAVGVAVFFILLAFAVIAGVLGALMMGRH